MRQVIEDAPIHKLEESNVGEHAFWEALRAKCLRPDLKAFGLEGEVKREGQGAGAGDGDTDDDGDGCCDDDDDGD